MQMIVVDTGAHVSEELFVRVAALGQSTLAARHHYF
jgi:hypothetical protein